MRKRINIIKIAALTIIGVVAFAIPAFAGDDDVSLKFGIWEVIQILGALAFFVFGMKMMSDGIQRAAGSQMRNILRTMTKNRFLGVFTGFITTALVQSSSATTVMTVSFVNAGLLTLIESAGVMMGANVGTTITGWIVSLLGFKLNLSSYSVPLFAIGVPLLFSKKGRFKYWGEFLIGFAIIFLGLSYLREAVPDIKDNKEILNFLANFTEYGIFSRILFVFVGTLTTILVQSSSAAMLITLTMSAQGWLPFEVAAAMILGENIGTTITAEIASLVGNTAAKRSARIHSMFNIIGVIWMIILLPFVLPIFSNILQTIFGIPDPFTHGESMPIALAAFHTFFNVTNVIIMLGFVPLLVKVAVWTVREKGGEEEDIARLQFINSANRTPELATVEIQKEIARYGDITTRMLGFSRSLINSTDETEMSSLIAKLEKYEDVTDKFEEEITEYITNLSDNEMTHKTSVRLRSFFNICNDLERIGDIFFQLSKTMEDKLNRKIYFLPKQRNQLNELLEIVQRAFDEMNYNLNLGSYDEVNLSKSYGLEDEINTKRNSMRSYNSANLENEDYNANSALIFTILFSSLERVGDHLVNINESAAGEI